MTKPDDCEYVQRLISAGRDERSPWSSRRAINEHLKGCEHCREFSATVEGHAAMLKTLPGAEMNTDPGLGIESHVRQPLLKRLWSAHVSVPVPVAAVTVVAAIVLTALVPQFFNHSNGETSDERESFIRTESVIEYVQAYRLAPQSAALERPSTPKSN